MIGDMSNVGVGVLYIVYELFLSYKGPSSFMGQIEAAEAAPF